MYDPVNFPPFEKSFHRLKNQAFRALLLYYFFAKKERVISGFFLSAALFLT